MTGSAWRVSAFALLALAGCTGGAPESYRPDMYSEHHPARPAETTSRLVRCQEIVFWEKVPKVKKEDEAVLKERVGYLETRDVTPKGSLNTVTQYLVYDLNKRAPFGLISSIGETYVWSQGGAVGNGRWQRIGEYSVEDAVKALFKRSYKANVLFDELPYVPADE
jgi:hypothetical protein